MSVVVNYIAPSDHTGYACAAEGYMQLLRDAGIRVRFQPLHPGSGLGLWYECAPLAESLEPNAITLLHCVPEYYEPLKAWLRQRGVQGPFVGMTVWETSQIPVHWVEVLNHLDALIVPSRWNRRIFQQCGVRVPIYDVPHVSQFDGVRADEASVRSLRRRIPDLSNTFVFYSIGAWSYRKGNDLLVRAFRKAFAGRRDVMLVLKTSKTSWDPQRPRWQRGLRRLAGIQDLHQKLLHHNVPGVSVLTEDLSDDEIRALHTIGDCYVSCARGEGWGLGLYEAILFGNGALAPQEGGHREYLADSTFEGFLPGRRTAVRTPGRDASYTSDQEWYEVDVAQAARKMASITADMSKLQTAVNHVSAELRSSLSRERILTQLMTAIATTSVKPNQA